MSLLRVVKGYQMLEPFPLLAQECEKRHTFFVSVKAEGSIFSNALNNFGAAFPATL